MNARAGHFREDHRWYSFIVANLPWSYRATSGIVRQGCVRLTAPAIVNGSKLTVGRPFQSPSRCAVAGT